MRTKPPEPILTAFPTCGEVFHYLITALNLPAWADAFHDSTGKRREVAEIKAKSDQLRDWATEAEGRVPSRDELEQFICDQVRGFPKEKELSSVLCDLWNRVLDEHTSEVREQSTYLERAGTRAWCARWRAPATLYFLWILQKLLRQLEQSKGPMLGAQLDVLLAKAWPDEARADKPPKHPLHHYCYDHYGQQPGAGSPIVDAKTIAAWNAGEDRPSFGALGRQFSQFPDKLGLVLNFAFAGLLETLANTLRTSISEAEWPQCRQLLLGRRDVCTISMRRWRRS